eukprot:TRINITY_DN9955_c0_g1_i1.p1 TRINITY_DN9955_c0_g1~~TRINITY_DN9955_c0_g1_i1.p1  ORF type:complete len:219 (+),score=36.28 TRINITY_DN9955_c0_g1_i1:88-744(+)
MALKRGALIVFEGCDRSGKTTQIKRLVDRLNNEGKKAKMMRFPERDTGIGGLINQYLSCSKDLDDHVIHLLFSANRWELVKDIRRDLEAGITVIIDRYAFSGVAFSAAKPGIDLTWCKQPDVGLPRPDLVCFLDVSEAVAKSRADFGGERYEKTEFQARVRSNYTKLSDSTWKFINADKTMDEVHADLYAVIDDEMQRAKEPVVPGLWMDDGLQPQDD